jgi:hypothetical protein
MTTLDRHPAADPTTDPAAAALRRLYLLRFGFAAGWALVVVVAAPALGALGTALLVLYPLVDLAAAVVDHAGSRATRPAPALVVNMGLSLLAAIGLAVAAGSGLRAVLLVWGTWAVTAGAVQLVVGAGRRALGGQWAMILSGAISVLAGVGFVVQSGRAAASLTGLAGYAALGGIFFLVSALRLGRAAGNRR